MEYVHLDPAQRKSFEDDGFLVVKNALGKESVDRLVAAGDRLASGFLNKPEVHDRPEYNQLDLRPGLLKDSAFLKLVTNASTVPLVVQLMSPNIHLHSTALICKRPERPDLPRFRRGWHRDIRIPRDLGHRALPMVGIKVCYCLTDFHQPNSGMTLMARGTHRRESPLEIPKGDVDPRDVEVCDLKLNAGDALFFENRIFHTAAPNLSDRVSKVAIFGYAYRWMKQEVYLENPDMRALSMTNGILRQLLGGYRDVDTPPWALQRWARDNGVLQPTPPWAVEV